MTPQPKTALPTGPQGAGRSSARLCLSPVNFADACTFVALHHRHHDAPQGHKFSLAVAVAGEAVVRGVIIVGRPVSRHQDDGLTLEVTRCCTDGLPNGCSFLYRAAWRAAKALAYSRLITYTLPAEGGASLRASGWRELRPSRGGQWSVPSRPRAEVRQPGVKTLWELAEN